MFITIPYKNNEYYGVEVGEIYDSRSSQLIFDEQFTVPIITTMHGDDFIYEDNNKIRYGVWINTNVASKI